MWNISANLWILENFFFYTPASLNIDIIKPNTDFRFSDIFPRKKNSLLVQSILIHYSYKVFYGAELTTLIFFFSFQI